MKFMHKLLPFAVVTALAAGFGYVGYSYSRLYLENAYRAERIAALEDDIFSLRGKMERAMSESAELAGLLEAEKRISDDLSRTLADEKNKNQVFEAQIRDISFTVGALQKLSETDRELLQKYSRVYFLSENYAPANLSPIDQRYIYDKNRAHLIHSGVAQFLHAMLASAERDGVSLKVVSAYRSFAEQISVKEGNLVTYGSGANQFSADQGYSEHQLGTTVDFTAPELNGLSLRFEDTAEYEWLEKNAYKFGFTLSYPRGNAYYHFEPWHWRFVGVSLATRLYNAGEYFYNLSQREIDEYLISIFD